MENKSFLDYYMPTFKDLSSTQLRKIIRDYNLHVKITNYSKMKKVELVQAIEEHLTISNAMIEPKNQTFTIKLPKNTSKEEKERIINKVMKTITDMKEKDKKKNKENVKEFIEKVKSKAKPKKNTELIEELKVFHSLTSKKEKVDFILKYAEKYGIKKVDISSKYWTEYAYVHEGENIIKSKALFNHLANSKYYTYDKVKNGKYIKLPVHLSISDNERGAYSAIYLIHTPFGNISFKGNNEYDYSKKEFKSPTEKNGVEILGTIPSKSKDGKLLSGRRKTENSHWTGKDYTLKDLVRYCKENNLDTKGDKATLVKRLMSI